MVYIRSKVETRSIVLGMTTVAVMALSLGSSVDSFVSTGMPDYGLTTGFTAWIKAGITLLLVSCGAAYASVWAAEARGQYEHRAGCGNGGAVSETRKREATVEGMKARVRAIWDVVSLNADDSRDVDYTKSRVAAAYGTLGAKPTVADIMRFENEGLQFKAEIESRLRGKGKEMNYSTVELEDLDEEKEVAGEELEQDYRQAIANAAASSTLAIAAVAAKYQAEGESGPISAERMRTVTGVLRGLLEQS
jgi:hypothetical protein